MTPSEEAIRKAYAVRMAYSATWNAKIAHRFPAYQEWRCERWRAMSIAHDRAKRDAAKVSDATEYCRRTQFTGYGAKSGT